MGRPAKMWALTRAANRFFPDGNAELLVNMIDLVRQVHGEDGLGDLIRARADEQFERYRERLQKADSLHGKLEVLAEIRTEEGYMAEVREAEDGGYLLIENHCPICEAAETCQKFCSDELGLFQRLLSEEAEVLRTEHMLQGSRRCVYRVRTAG